MSFVVFDSGNVVVVPFLMPCRRRYVLVVIRNSGAADTAPSHLGDTPRFLGAPQRSKGFPRASHKKKPEKMLWVLRENSFSFARIRVQNS